MNMSNAGTLFNREPAMIYGLINAGIALGITFGLELTADQVGAIMAFTNIVLAVVTRQSVVPNATHQAQVSDALYKGTPDMPDLTVLPPAAQVVKEEMDATAAQKIVDAEKKE